MQLKELWNFMQVDMAADNFEAEMRKSPNRQKLLKRRNLLLELQNNNKRIDSEIAVMQDRLEAVRDEAARLEALLKTNAFDVQQAETAAAPAAEKPAEAKPTAAAQPAEMPSLPEAADAGPQDA